MKENQKTSSFYTLPCKKRWWLTLDWFLGQIIKPHRTQKHNAWQMRFGIVFIAILLMPGWTEPDAFQASALGVWVCMVIVGPTMFNFTATNRRINVMFKLSLRGLRAVNTLQKHEINARKMLCETYQEREEIQKGRIALLEKLLDEYQQEAVKKDVGHDAKSAP